MATSSWERDPAMAPVARTVTALVERGWTIRSHDQDYPVLLSKRRHWWQHSHRVQVHLDAESLDAVVTAVRGTPEDLTDMAN